MSHETVRHPPHADDAELVRLLDDEGGEEMARTAAHADGCVECGARLARLRHSSAALRRLIEQGESAVAVPDLTLDQLLARRSAASPSTRTPAAAGVRRPARWQPLAERPWLRAAAVVALLLALGLGAPPVRAWVLERLGDAAALLRGDTAPEAPVPSPAGPDDGSAVVSFEPASAAFAVDLRHAQRGGRLVVRLHDGPLATATVVDGGAELLVRPGGLAIGNAPESESSYVVTVPAGLERVVIRLGGRQVDAFRPGDLPPPLERSYDLAGLPE